METTMTTRPFTTEDGEEWIAFAEDAIVAHGKPGALLAFRPAGAAEDETVRSTVTFNSQAAAEFALRTMGVKELRRRLRLARAALGGV